MRRREMMKMREVQTPSKEWIPSEGLQPRREPPLSTETKGDTRRERAEDKNQTEGQIFQMTLEKLINQIKRLDLVIRDLQTQAGKDDWAIGVIPKIEVQNRNIWEAPQDHDVVLPCNSNFKNVNGLVETAINKLGGKDGLKKQGKRKGEVDIMIHSLGFPDNDGNVKHIARSIYYPITGDEGERAEVEDETLFQAMEKIKSHMVRQKKTVLAVPELDGIGGIMFTRILEYIFADSEVQITMYGLERNSKQPPTTTTKRVRLNSVNGNKGQKKKQ
ncbi:hypothetical protein JTB14_029407 [Gonioctena quinquepunctata]|nr:hypothetical protein JTB14_029407 [Gonioctena quinquepunctata]